MRDAQDNPAMTLDEGGMIEARTIEVDPRNNQVVFEARISGDSSYRMMRAGFYDRYADANDLLNLPLRDTATPNLSQRLRQFTADVKVWLAPVKTQVKRLLKSIWFG